MGEPNTREQMILLRSSSPLSEPIKPNFIPVETFGDDLGPRRRPIVTSPIFGAACQLPLLNFIHDDS